jgi:hypothetical protein
MNETTMFQPSARETFCDRFFAVVGAPCMYAKPSYREFQLPVDVDKELTDRPYYWLWVERTGEQVEPTILRLAFDEDVAERESERLKQEAMSGPKFTQLNEVQRMFFRSPTAEYVAFGSFRLEKIFESVKRRGVSACVKETGVKGALRPWLLCQCLITYQCDLSKQRIASIGINLHTGQVSTDFLEKVRALDVQPADSTECLSGTKRSVEEGLRFIQDYLREQIEAESHAWADEALARLDSELAGMDLYYDSIRTDIPEEEQPLVELERARKRHEHEERIRPVIDCEVTQMAIIRCSLKG